MNKIKNVKLGFCLFLFINNPTFSQGIINPSVLSESPHFGDSEIIEAAI
jgi:hypothetical protein